MSAALLLLVYVVGVPVAAFIGYFVVGEMFLGWLCRMGTRHIRPRHPRPRQ